MSFISNPQPGVGTTVEASEITFPLNVTGAEVGTDVITSKVSGDAQVRFVHNIDGKLEWGPGNAALDVNLYRLAEDVLRTNDSLKIDGVLTTDARLQPRTEQAGQILVASNEATPTIVFGLAGDTNLYRSAENVLKTDDKFVVVLELEIDGDLNHDGEKAGFFGIAPAIRPEVKKVALTADELAAALATLGIVKIEA